MGGDMGGGITTRDGLTYLCQQRDRAVYDAERGVAKLVEGLALLRDAQTLARETAQGRQFTLRDRVSGPAYSRLFLALDGPESLQAFTHATDAAIWGLVADVVGLNNLQDTTAREEFETMLANDVEAVTPANVRAKLNEYVQDSGLIFQRGLARAFSDLDRRFKSHDAFKLGTRMILKGVISSWGSLERYNGKGKTIADIERVFAVLDDEEPNPGELYQAIEDSRRKGYGRRQGVCETRYFKIRTFMNGNAHLWFTRPDLVTKANQVLADYYGAVLPDAVPEDLGDVTSTALCKDLSFYASPPKVVQSLLSNVEHLPRGSRVLEPSAGTGDIAVALVARGYAVTAIEVDPSRERTAYERVRAASVTRTSGSGTMCANFLQLPPYTAEPYDAVVMNPPFSGDAVCNHIRHAWKFLAYGGTLTAVVPTTVHLGTTPAKRLFCKWVKSTGNDRDYRTWRDLPAESFLTSGTKVNTMILTMTKRSL